MHDLLIHWLTSYGYVVLFLLVGLESLGIPLPGETALVTASAFAAQGHLSIVGVIATAALAAIFGDNGGYWIGRKGGLAFARRYGRVLRIDERTIERVRAYFDLHGAKTVFIGRFIALLRTWAAFFAGVAAMRYSTFMMYNAIGGIVWASLFGALGYIFGRNLPALEHNLGLVSVVLLVAVIVFAIVFVWRTRQQPGSGPNRRFRE